MRADKHFDTDVCYSSVNSTLRQTPDEYRTCPELEKDVLMLVSTLIPEELQLVVSLIFMTCRARQGGRTSPMSFSLTHTLEQLIYLALALASPSILEIE